MAAGPYGHKGSADLVVCYHGYYVAIEAKAGTGLSDAQIIIKNKVEDSGGIYAVVHNLDDVISIFNNLNAAENISVSQKKGAVRNRIIDYFAIADHIPNFAPTIRDVANDLGISLTSARNNLRQLVGDGVLVRSQRYVPVEVSWGEGNRGIRYKWAETYSKPISGE